MSTAADLSLHLLFHSGALPEALVAWSSLQAEGFPMHENTYSAYQECLTRCGAWTSLVAAIKDQHARHLVDPSSSPALRADALAAAIRLANRLVKHPRYQTHHSVDLTAFKTLRAELESIASKDLWAETTRLLESGGRLSKAARDVVYKSTGV